MAEIYKPSIVGYKPFYIQSASDSAALDTLESWGMVAKSHPYPVLPTPKEPYKNDWHDENGDDEYNAAMYYESMDIDVSFYVKAYADGSTTAMEVLLTQIDDFFNKVKVGEFKIYDAYTGVGRQCVRFNGSSDKEFKERNNWARCIFTISLKVNDPVTRCVLDNNKIVVK